MEEKRPYTKPSILKVQLSHEQAVLSACSVTGTTLSSNVAPFFCVPGAGNCRKRGGAGGSDSCGGS